MAAYNEPPTASEMQEQAVPEDGTPWPRTLTGRYVCTSERPMPVNAGGFWLHPEAITVGESPDCDVDYYRCPACGHRWSQEVPI